MKFHDGGWWVIDPNNAWQATRVRDHRNETMTDLAFANLHG